MRAIGLLLTYVVTFAVCVGLTVTGALVAREYSSFFSSYVDQAGRREIRSARTLVLLNNLRTLLLTSVPCAGILIGFWSAFMTGVVLGLRTEMGLVSVATVIFSRPHAILEYSAHALILTGNLLLSVGVMIKGKTVGGRELAIYAVTIAIGALMLSIAALLEIP